MASSLESVPNAVLTTAQERLAIVEPINEKRWNDDSTCDSPKKAEGGGSMVDYIRIFRYADRLSLFLFVVCISGFIISGAAMPLMTLIFGQFSTEFNNYAAGRANTDSFMSQVNRLVLYFVYLFAARFVILYLAHLGMNIAALRTTSHLRQAFLEATLRQEVWHFDNPGNGSPATQITTNGNRINQGIADRLSAFFQGLSLFFSAFIVAIVIQWKLALITMSILPLLILITGTCVAIDAALEGKILRIYSRAAIVAQEAISSVKTVHAFWAQEKMTQRFNEFLEQAAKQGQKKSPNFGVLLSTNSFLVNAAIPLAFWQGFRMFQSGEIGNIGTVITVVMSVTLGATSASVIAPQYEAITNAASAAAELFTIIDKKSELDPLSTEGLQPPTCHGDIEVRNLSFAYPSRPSAPVLNSLNMTIPAGKVTALVGASGCGKSTLIGLLERWYVPTQGEIILGGVNISNYNTKWLRSNIRLVQQEPVLFRGTVFENVARGFLDKQASLPVEQQTKLVEEACKASNAHDFIQELPNGYHTQVGERASMLSGGQKQRLAIARSIISDPQVLLLDEATSALDPKAEKTVQAALSRISANKTTLVIAHKLATVKAADNIVFMSYGKVIEQGTHDELIAKVGQYAALVRAQDLGGEKGTTNFELEDEDEKALILQQAKSAAKSLQHDAEFQRLRLGTVDYSLLRCILVMLFEQKGLNFWFAICYVGVLIGGLANPAQAVLFAKSIQVYTLGAQEAQKEANFFALMFFIVALAIWVGYFSIGYGANAVGQAVTKRYRLEMMKRMISLDSDFFDRPENSSGALTSKLSTVPNDLQELISTNLLLLGVVVVSVISTSILAIAYGWKLGLVMVFGGLPLLVGAGFIRIRLEQKLENEIGKRFTESAGLTTEAVTSIRAVASLTLETQIMKEYSSTINDVLNRSFRSFFGTMFWYALSQSIEFLIQALGFWYGSRLLTMGGYTTTQFFTIYIAIIFSGQAAASFFSYSTSITKAKVAANYLLWLRTLQAKISETDDNRNHGPSGDGPVGIENVHFRYKQRDAAYVLRGISMNIKPGTHVACVGPSGCGKSTLISLIERFYDPTSGQITLNGINIATMSPRRYRQYMSLVQQEPTLFQGSIRENISLGLESPPTDDEIYTACRQANALEFIQSLPSGLSTPCGSKGLQFSGGQRQRIAIARALIRKPRLLLLDEATSALDTLSERLVQEALDDAASGQTTIAVAHRLSTIRRADVIFVFAGGRVVEMGTHEELLALRGRYYEMCLAQSLDKA